MKGVYKYDPVQGSTTVSTGENGVLLLKGLEAGVHLRGKPSPSEGYTENFKPTFTVDMSVVPNRGIAANAPMIQNPLTDDNNGWKLASDWTDPTDNCERAKVKNVKSLTQLPLTGGAGIILFLRDRGVAYRRRGNRDRAYSRRQARVAGLKVSRLRPVKAARFVSADRPRAIRKAIRQAYRPRAYQRVYVTSHLM